MYVCIALWVYTNKLVYLGSQEVYVHRLLFSSCVSGLCEPAEQVSDCEVYVNTQFM